MSCGGMGMMMTSVVHDCLAPLGNKHTTHQGAAYYTLLPLTCPWPAWPDSRSACATGPTRRMAGVQHGTYGISYRTCSRGSAMAAALG
jgi:hypothetical protein